MRRGRGVHMPWTCSLRSEGKSMNSRMIVSAAAALLSASPLDRAVADETDTAGSQHQDWRDMATDPGDDFYLYANGRWLKSYELPADRQNYNMLEELNEQAGAAVQAIVVSADAHEQDTDLGKLARSYRSYIDMAERNRVGATPVGSLLSAIYAAPDRSALAEIYSEPLGATPIEFEVFPSPMDPTSHTIALVQGGLGLPAPGYYLDEAPEHVAARQAYLAHIERLFSLAGLEGGDGRAAAILELESRIAGTHLKPEEMRDLQRIFNPMDAGQLAAAAPSLPWDVILQRRDLDRVNPLIVTAPAGFAALGEILESTELEVVKDYVAFHVLDSLAEDLDARFQSAHFAFHGTALSGVSEMAPIEQRAMARLGRDMPDAIGRAYVERHFDASVRREVETLVDDLQSALAEAISASQWMDEPTRTEALAKLRNLDVIVGSGTSWIDYSSLEIGHDWFSNAVALRRFNWEQKLRQLASKVEKGQMPIPPHSVGGMVNPVLNQAIFSAAILQPPFFDPAADPAANFAGIGGVIGHELSHLFDDGGRRFDAEGAIRDWWSEKANAAFLARAERLTRQYSAYEPLPGVPVNGAATLGENIADIAGLQIAYRAYHRYLDRCCDGAAPVIDGLTGDQRFFLAWAHHWRGKIRNEALRQQLLADNHSPDVLRVNGVVRNIDAWYEAFAVSEGDALYLSPEERVTFWPGK